MTDSIVAGGPGLAQERRLVTPVPGPRSQQLFEARSAVVARGVSTVLPVFIERAGGGVVVDVDGNSFIDFGSGIAVVSVGNAATAVTRRVQEQVARFTHTCFMVTPYQEYVEVCSALNRLTPGDHEKRSALFNSGAEAVENAVKIARSATKRSAVVVFDHGYHGRTNLTMALTAKNMPYKHSFGPFAPEVYRVPMSYPFRDGLDGAAAAARAIDVIEKQVGADEVACVLIEPIQGEGGFVVPAPGFLPALAEWCRKSGALFAADEIQSGFCRTGDWFACEDEDVVPDLVTTAKGIAGGLPLAGVTGRAEVMDAPHVGGLGGTYGGNPVACAAALGAIETMEDQDLAGAARRIGTTMLARLHELASRSDVIGDVRGRGAMVAVELTRPGTTEPDAASAAAVAKACHGEGLLVLTCGTYGNVLRFLPPLVMPDHLLDEGMGVIEKAFASLG
ncbi:MAG: 4-aminobutyrate aminotransferase / (S)-3-amino-2-methylpropionate transaminase / 5-aminovalerate [Actinomycetota bacterium]|jgi:4-aminobutyrate aminotransferase/(S)-3-amino-2-methylpropionate transaminase|nr:4-aminobutyrate aminotransferase / (S)-3-amino-2-methylpropionate transaminase / 5-aminovalerate [Actinomycetota bacterium]